MFSVLAVACSDTEAGRNTEVASGWFLRSARVLRVHSFVYYVLPH